VRGFHDAAPPLLRMPYITKPANGRLGGGSPVQFDSDVWRTGQKVSLYLSSRAFNDKMALIRIYRDDGVLCQSLSCRLSGSGIEVVFPELLLLPGRYEIRAGTADSPIPFRVVSSRFDHGTVFLKHRWNWSVR